MEEILERNTYRLLTSEDGFLYSGILNTPQGLLANEFSKFLKKDEHEDKRRDTVKKFNFLILAEIVLRCKDCVKRRHVFDYIVAEFFDRKNKDRFIKLKLIDLVDDLNDKDINDDQITEHLTTAKEDVNVWSECLAPIYDRQFVNSEDFKELKKRNVFVACLLSIL